MDSHPDYPPKKIGEIMRIRGYALIFALLGVFFTAIAYGSSDVKEILTHGERLWLTQNQPRLILAVEIGYAPFVFIDQTGQPAGFAHDYMRLVESKLDIHFKQRRFLSLNDIFEKVRSREVHIVNAVTNTPERSRFLAMTGSFVSVPNVIVVRKERLGQMREKDLSGLKVSLVKSYAVTEHLTNKNPGFAPNLTPDDLSALLNVSFGQSDAAVIDLATASYLISQKGITNLRVAGEVAFDIRLSIGSPIDEPMLHSILQKGLDAITDEERQEIHKRWINASSQNILTDRRFWVVAGSVLFVILVIIAVILIRNRTLRQQIALRTEALAKEREYIAERKQLEQQLSRRLYHRDVMEHITRISLSSANIEELLGKVLDEILTVFDADRAWFLYPCDPDAHFWSVPMERTRPEWPGAFARGTAIPMTPEVAEVFREVLASAKPLPYGPAASRGIPAAVAEQFSIRSQIQMALRPRVGNLWTMGLHHCAQARAYDEDDLLLFNDIGQRVADALSSMTILKNLRESEENLNRAQAVAQIGSWLLDIPTNRLEWSAETYRMFGIPQQQTIDLEIFVATVHPDDRDFVLKAWGEALAGAPYDIEHRIVVGGQERWVRERAQIERDAEGCPLTGIGTVQDITGRKQLEVAQRESEELYHSLFENMLNGFAYCQMVFEGDQPQDFIYLSVNAAFETLTGLKNVVGKRVSEVVPGIQQTAAGLFELYGRVSLSGKPERFEIYLKALRQWFWVSVYSPQKGYFAVTFDVITERKQAEEKLRASEQKFMRLFMEIPIPLGVADKEGVIAHFNNKFTEVFGYTTGDVPTLDEWWLKAYPDETYRRWVLDNWNDAVAKATKEGANVESAEYRVTCKNGAERIVIIGGSSVEGGVLAIFNDITERKRMDEELELFRLMVEKSGDPIFMIDDDDGCRMMYVNEAAVKHYGTTREKILTWHIPDWDPNFTYEKLDEHVKEIKKLKNLTIESQHRVKGGSIVPVEISLNYMLYKGKVCHFGYFRNITERKEHEEELKRSNAELEQFSYAVSHDMRQPLRMISSYLQLLERSLAGQLDGEKRGYFDSAIEGAKRIDQMLVALLEYSRIGRKGEPPTMLDSRAMLDEALQFLQPTIAEAQAKVSIAGEWPRILASHDEILRLLQNLIGNAIKFRIAGQIPEITVTSGIVKNEWHLCVADNGVGIIPDQIKRLFQVFQRLQSREAYEGTGIGLALCRKIAEHHKGCIWAESAGEDQGSRFYVVLPVLQMKIMSQ